MLNRARALAAAALALLPVACGGKAADKTTSRPPPLVSIARVEARDVPVEVRAPVDLRPLIQADVGSKTLGYLDAVLVDRGDKVTRGQLLALVRPSDLPDQLAAARSNARAGAVGGRARAHELRSRQGAGARSRRVAAGAAAGAEPVRHRRGRAAGGAGADRGGGGPPGRDAHQLAARRAWSCSAASIRGRWSGRPAAARSSRSRGSTCCACSSPSTSASWPASASARTPTSRSTRSRARAFSGKVVRLAPALDPATRTLDAEVQLDNRSGELCPGMYGRGAIVIETHPHAPVVPVAARGAQQQAGVRLRRRSGRRRRPPAGDHAGRRRRRLVRGEGRPARRRRGGRSRASEGLSDGMKVRAARGPDPFAAGLAASRDARRSALRTAAHVADPPRAAQSGLHPDDVADDRGARLRVAAPPQRRSVPRDQHPGHPRRDLLHGRRARPTSRRRSPSRSSARSARRPASTASRASRSRASRRSPSGSTTASTSTTRSSRCRSGWRRS